MEIVRAEMEDYCMNMSDNEPVILQQINRDTHANVLKPRMLSGHFQGRVLSLIAKLVQPKSILEIGTYTGYATLCLAEGLAEGGEIITIEANEELESRILKNFEMSSYHKQISLKIGSAMDLIPKLDQSFDLVFIDADKKNYSHYYDLVFDKVTSGGIIMTDNVLWSGKIIDPKAKDATTNALRAFNQKLKDDPRTQKVLLPIRDGLFVSRKI